MKKQIMLIINIAFTILLICSIIYGETLFGAIISINIGAKAKKGSAASNNMDKEALLKKKKRSQEIIAKLKGSRRPMVLTKRNDWGENC